MVERVLLYSFLPYLSLVLLLSNKKGQRVYQAGRPTCVKALRKSREAGPWRERGRVKQILRG